MAIFAYVMCVSTINAEKVLLFNDNGSGGIHQTMANIVIEEGQYYVDLPITGYNGSNSIERFKVYRIKDSARLMYNQDHWAEKYMYVVERPKSFFSTVPYYFNMDMEWKPSLTSNPDDPDYVKPIKKITAYRDDYFQGKKEAIKVVLVEKQGTYLLYYGDDFFGANVISNKVPLDYAPSWSEEYEFRAKISGFQVYFNINN